MLAPVSTSPQSVDRILAVLEYLAAHKTGAGLAELARTVDAPKSSLTSLLAGMLERGHLVKDDAGLYRLGPRMFSMAMRIVGSLYQGGYIFYLNTTDGHGLVSDPGATRDSSPWSGVAWGCGSAEMPGADGTAIGDGQQNTIDIVTACPGSTTAASVCADLTLSGYSDWFLPSRDELALMYTNLKNNGNKGNLHANHYWSSSDWSTDSAYFVYFATGSAGQDAKTDPDRVRAVRAF